MMSWNRTSDFDFELPQHLIAQTPSHERDRSRLMVVDRKRETIEHHHFYELPELLGASRVHFVVNESKVIPARLKGVRLLPDQKRGGGVEFFLLEQVEPRVWQGLLKSSKRAEIGFRFLVNTRFRDEVEGEIVAVDREQGVYRARFSLDPMTEGGGGILPIPPYIRGGVANAEDEVRYQTEYAGTPGSVAAPTAGLHFTEHLIRRLRDQGQRWSKVTLHVGIGTFRPVKVENIEEHVMHQERYWVSDETADEIRRSKAEGVPILAVGTTSVRTLETASSPHGEVISGEGSSELFIRPGYRFQAVDQMITNFHLPKSSLLMLVSAFAGPELIREAYRIAVAEQYRFFSYGDAMWIR